LDELVQVPLLATIAAIIFEQSGDRPLPDNQYELYESYLKYLRPAHPATSSPFDEVCDPLLEHLGRVRMEADTSLVAAACEWTVQHLPDVVGKGQEELITYLAAVGPFVRRGPAGANSRSRHYRQSPSTNRCRSSSALMRRHIRIKAARALARWSEPCRSAARTLLAQLSGK
jgi:hypothetical protein